MESVTTQSRVGPYSVIKKRVHGKEVRYETTHSHYKKDAYIKCTYLYTTGINFRVGQGQNNKPETLEYH